MIVYNTNGTNGIPIWKWYYLNQNNQVEKKIEKQTKQTNEVSSYVLKKFINYEGYCVSSIIHYLTLKLKYLKKLLEF